MFRAPLFLLMLLCVPPLAWGQPKVRDLTEAEKAEAVAWLKRAEIEAAKVTDAANRSDLLNHLASVYGGLPDANQTAALCKAARGLARPRQDVPLAEQAIGPEQILIDSAYALALAGRDAEALKLTGDLDPFDRALALANVAEAQAFVGAWAKAKASIQKADAFIAENLDPEDGDHVRSTLAAAWVWIGNAEAADRQTQKIQSKHERIISMLDNAWLLLKSRRINPAEARQRIRSVAIHFLLMEAETKGWCASTLGAIHAELGDVEGAKHTLTMTSNPMHRASIRLSQAEAMVRSGKTDGLDQVLQQAVMDVKRIEVDPDFPEHAMDRGWRWYAVGYTHQFIGRAKDLEPILKTIASPYERGLLMGGAADAIIEQRRVPPITLKH